VAGTPVLVPGVPVLVDVVANDFPATGGLPGTADVAVPFAVPVKGVDVVWVAAWLPAFALVLAAFLVAGDALVFAGVGVAVGLFAAAGWPAGVGLLAPVFCAVAIVAIAATSARI